MFIGGIRALLLRGLHPLAMAAVAGHSDCRGIALVTAALPRGPLGPYQLQAAIAALHD